MEGGDTEVTSNLLDCIRITEDENGIQGFIRICQFV